MMQPVPVDILSDSDSDSDRGEYRNLRIPNDAIDLVTPPPFPQSKKKQRTEAFSNPTNSAVFIIDDDHTPCKKNPSSLGRTSSSTPSFVAETPFSDASLVKCSRGKCSPSGEDLATDELIVADTPMSENLKPEVSIAKYNSNVCNGEPARSLTSNHNLADVNGWICVESDNEENAGGFESAKLTKSILDPKLTTESEFGNKFIESSFSPGKSQMQEGCSSPNVLEDNISMACDDTDDKASKLESVDQILIEEDTNGPYMKEKKNEGQRMKPKRTSKEERLRLLEEKKQQKEQEKLLKAASKAEVAEMKKTKKEMQKWEKGKYALKSVVAEIDKKVVELGSIGGHLLTRFAEKGLQYRITSNPIERTIVWSMIVPEEISAIASERIEISYVLIVYEAEEFCNIVLNESIVDHVKSVQQHYPHHTVCYATNRLMAYINKREQAQYKNPANYSGWKRPAVEEVFTKLATHFCKVHSRQCVDEAELAEHVVGLTCSLASCQFRKKLTRLSVNANGSIIPKDCIDKNLIKKNLWLKALVAIPKVQPRFAIAIWKKYPTMKSLLSVYMDSSKSLHEKEFLLKDLTTEGLFGDDRRVGEVCSKRIYRILMAQSGNIKTDDVENGADFFNHQST